MAYPAIDADTVAAYELNEVPSGGGGTYDIPHGIPPIPPDGDLADIVDGFDVGDASRFAPKFHSPPHFGGYYGFKDQVTGDKGGALYDTLPASPPSFVLGVPTPFGPEHRGVGFRQYTATADRDYLVLPVAALPTGAVTVSMWVQPFSGIAAVWEILHKEYQDGSPTDGVLAGTWASPFYGGIQLYALSTSSGEWGASINIAGTVHSVSITGNGTERFRLRYNDWNHIGATYDGSAFCLYINGQLAATLAISGAIDYGAGAWVCGALRDSADISQMNGTVCRIRWEKVAKPLSYFFDAYTSVGGGGSGTLAVLNMLPADFGTDPAVAKRTPVTFTVRGSSHVLVVLRYKNSHERIVVYDDGFEDGYDARSSVAVVDANNLDFVVLPNGGWRESIGCLSVIAVSDDGEAINFGDE